MERKQTKGGVVTGRLVSMLVHVLPNLHNSCSDVYS